MFKIHRHILLTMQKPRNQYLRGFSLSARPWIVAGSVLMSAHAVRYAVEFHIKSGYTKHRKGECDYA